MDDGRVSGTGPELSIVSGRSCTMNLRLGNASARAMLAWPLDPPSWMRRNSLSVRMLLSQHWEKNATYVNDGHFPQ